MKLLWVLYILIGIGAFAISFFLEYVVFVSITNQPDFALFLTLVFECAKVLTIIIHRYVADKKGYTIPDSVIYLNVFFKTGLVLLSLICSIAIISDDMDRPNLTAVKEKDRAVIDGLYSNNLSILINQRDDKFEKITGEIKEKYKNRYEELANYYEPRIEKEESLRDMEFENEINGVRKGVRWAEHDRKVKELTSEYKEEKQKLHDTENNELSSYMTSIQNEFQTKIEDLNQKNTTDLESLEANTYENDKRVENEIVSAFLMTISEGLGIEMEYLRFTLLFSILISALLESTIFLTFNYVVMFQQNVISQSSAPETIDTEYEEVTGKHGEEHYSKFNTHEGINSGGQASQEDILRERIKNISDYFRPGGRDNDDQDPCY